MYKRLAGVAFLQHTVQAPPGENLFMLFPSYFTVLVVAFAFVLLLLLVAGFRALRKSSTLFWCTCLLPVPKLQGRPQGVTVVTGKLETKDVVKDLGIELLVYILRMQTFLEYTVSGFSSTRQRTAGLCLRPGTVRICNSNEQTRVIMPPPPPLAPSQPPTLKTCKNPAVTPNAASLNLCACCWQGGHAPLHDSVAGPSDACRDARAA